MSAPQVVGVYIRNYRSIGDEQLRIRMPARGPLVVLGENNAGKSNLGKAIEIVLGERWAGTVQLDDHDFHGRDGDGIEVQISVDAMGVKCPRCSSGEIDRIHWSYDTGREGGPITYNRRCTGCHNTYMSNDIKAQLGCLVIGADRRLSYQLSYASKYTFLARLMTHFHDAMKANATVEAALKELFSMIRSEFDKVDEFKEFQKLLVTTVESFGGNFRYGLDIDFSAYDPSNYFRSLRVNPALNGEVRNFDELGTGQEQVLALAFAYAYARAFGKHSGLLLIIDEPESHLHPLAQRWLADRIRDLSSQEGLQVMISTHSPLFIDLGRPENLLVVRRAGEDAPTSATQLTLPELEAKLVARHAKVNGPHTIGPFYAASATPEILAGFFARCCALVEGPTEAMALPPLLRLVGFDTLREGVAVIPCGGLSGIARWIRLFEAFGIPTYAIVDSDSDLTEPAQADQAAARQDLEATLEAIGTSSPARAITVDSAYAVLDPNFEGAMNAALGAAWDQAYESAKDLVGAGRQLKPLRARHAASVMQLSDLDDGAQEALRRLALALTDLSRYRDQPPRF